MGQDQKRPTRGHRWQPLLIAANIRDGERLTKLSEAICDLNDVSGIIERVVAVSVMALTGKQPKTRIPAVTAQRGR
jgi:hypothetical protein